jgi:hypothetical protein
MSIGAGTGPARWTPPAPGGDDDALAWLDALAAGSCTPEAFLEAMHEQFDEDRDEGWEVLSLLDQYYRRGKIRAEVFHSVKSSLEGFVINGEQGAAASARPRASVNVTAPTPPSKSQSRAAPAAPSKAQTKPRVSAPAQTQPPARVQPPAHAQPPAHVQLPAHAQPPAQMQPIVHVQLPAHAQPLAQAQPIAQVQAPAQPQAQPPPNSSSAVRDVVIGDVLRNRYKIRAVLGHGGMGTVFEAIDEYRLELPTSGRQLAVKVLHTAVTQRNELLTELRREFQHLQSLSHPNIVRVHEFDRDGDLAFFTMELLSGALLSRALNARHAAALPRAYALAVMRDVGAALSHAHSRGVVHGDINPQNIFITNEGELRVLDFGASHALLRDWRTGDRELLQRAPVATPGYASCQLLEGQHPDARDDLFAFACVAYLLLSGQHPFPNRNALESRRQGLRPRRPPRLTDRQWRVLREGLRWERDRRPSDVQNWLDRFGLSGAAPRLPPLPMLANAPAPRRPTLAPAATVLVLALLAAAAYWRSTDDESLARRTTELGELARAALVSAGALPAAPGAGRQTSPLPAPAAAPPGAAPPAAAPPAAALPAAAPPAAALPAAGAPAAGAHSAAAHAASAISSPTAPSVASPAPTPRTAAAAPRPDPVWPIRIEMAADTVDVLPTETTAHVVVRRRGNIHGDTSFTWWTESGTANPVRDFAPVSPRVENIPDGTGSVTLSIPVSGSPRTQPRSFYVVIDRSESGAALGARTLTMVTLQPTD